MARMLPHIGDSPKARMGVVVALWALALLVGFALGD
jgi:hypothetical protein